MVVALREDAVTLETTFPRYRAYLEGLPAGLDSYPACVEKAAVFRQSLESAGAQGVAGKMPPEMRAMVENPAPHSSWISQTRVLAMHLVLVDLVFLSEQAYVDYCLAGNRSLLRGPLYGFLFKLVSFTTIVRGATSRWAQMHRGLSLNVVGDPERGRVELEMGFPPGLVTPLHARGYATAFQAAMDASNARGQAHVQEYNPTSARFLCTWT
jgi:hypothetical protein